MNNGNATLSPSPTDLIEQGTKERTGWLDGWYRLTAPKEPPTNATLAQRELARRGRLTSTILLFVIILIVAMLPIAIFANRILFPILLGALLVSFISLFLNRSGKIIVTGVLMVCFVDIGFATGLVTTHGGLGVYNLPTFDLLAISELLAVSLLPPRSVFVVAAANSIFIWIDIAYFRHDAQLGQLLASSGYGIVARPIVLQIIVAVVTYLWVRSATQAIARADRAEVIASLEHAIAEQEHAVAQEKRLLDLSIQQIVETHMRAANGDFNARVPLTQDNVLWQIAGSLNNLLARIQRLRQSEEQLQRLQPQIQRARRVEYEFQRTRQEAMRLQAILRDAKLKQYPLHAPKNGTFLDPVIVELDGSYLLQEVSPTPVQERFNHRQEWEK